MDEYVILKEIGKGSYGRAMKAQRRNLGGIVVIKVIPMASLTTRQRSDAITEVNVLRQLRHPFIVKHIDNFTESRSLYIVMEYANGGDLAARIKATRISGNLFPDVQVSRWFTQILLGLSFIHSKNIMHRDLKPQNLFLTADSDRILIGDFGVCKVMESKQQLAETITGTPYYLSPEMFQNKPYSLKSDVWALGCILYEMASLTVPFDATDVRSLSVRVCRGSNPPFPSRYSPGIRSIFLETMQRDYRSRPSADELLSRPFIQGIVGRLLGDDPSAPTKASACTTSTCASTRLRSPSPLPSHRRLSVASPSPRPPLYRRPDVSPVIPQRKPSPTPTTARPMPPTRCPSPITTRVQPAGIRLRSPSPVALVGIRSASPAMHMSASPVARPKVQQFPVRSASRARPVMRTQASPSPQRPLLTKPSTPQSAPAGPVRSTGHQATGRIPHRLPFRSPGIYPQSPLKQRLI